MRVIALSLIGWVALLAPAVHAEDPSGCNKFAWSLARERSWFAAPEKVSVSTGQTLASIPQGAFVLKLQPGASASFARPPERMPKSEGWFGGAVWLPSVERSATYQVTLSEEAWIDVIQDGKYVRSIGSSGRSDCPGLRKSVRFVLAATPVVLQLSGAVLDAIVVAISPIE